MNLYARPGKSSLLNPVRFGQLAHEPASGTSVSSCLSNGADASCSKMFDSIHAANSRTGIRTWLLPSLVHKPAKRGRECFLLLRSRELGDQQSVADGDLVFQECLGHGRDEVSESNATVDVCLTLASA